MGLGRRYLLDTKTLVPYADPEWKKEYHRRKSAEHYQKNKAKVKATSKVSRKMGKAAWVIFKSTLSCTKCKCNHPAALDFHHVDPTNKLDNVFNLVSCGQFAKAYEETKKCIVLCSNCHRIHHHNERLALKLRRKKKKLE